MKLDLVAGIPFVYRDARDRYVLRRVVEDNIYGATAWPGHTVIDVGAHIGSFAILAARLGGKVIAVEPHVENFAYLQVNVAGSVHGHPIDVTAVCAAMGPRTGLGRLYLSQSDSSAHTLYPPDGTNPTFQECMNVELLELLQHYRVDRVAMLKLDCEGAEYDIIPTVLQNPRRFLRLAIDFHKMHGVEDWRSLEMWKTLALHYYATPASSDNADEWLFELKP